jgi:hypothetical protein
MDRQFSLFPFTTDTISIELRTRSSHSKKTAKKVFNDQDAPGNVDDDTCTDLAAEPRYCLAPLKTMQ